ncbi:MAG TPA: hypothetical protein VMT00_13670 [Thermoanaerobaculia bacterium]|nr:hypothetical protein [Thermoanaerobaculia bacterium]
MPKATAGPDPIERRLASGLFLLTFVTCTWFFGGTGWNQSSSFALTRAIVERGTLRIDAYRETTEDIANIGGRVYSNKAPGLSLLAVPPYAVIHAIERRAGIDPGIPLVAARNMYLCTVAICGVAGAAIPAMLYVWGRRRLGVSHRTAVLAALLTALATPLLPYATVLVAHVPNAAVLLAALMLARRDGAGSAAASGAFSGLAALLNYLCLPVVGLTTLLVALPRPGRLRRVAAHLRGAFPPLLLLAWYQVQLFGTIFRNPITAHEIFVSEKAWMGIIKPPSADALIGITISPYRGLFYLSPILLFGVWGLVRAWRAGRERPALAFIAATGFLFFAFNITFNGWSGGSAIGPRYLVPLMPFLGIGLLSALGIEGARRRRIVTALVIVLAIVSFANNFAATAVDPLPWEPVRDPLGEHIYPALVTGEADRERMPWLAGGRVSISQDGFNWGELLFGSGSAWSLAPILVLMLLGLVLLMRTAARRDACETV